MVSQIDNQIFFGRRRLKPFVTFFLARWNSASLGKSFFFLPQECKKHLLCLLMLLLWGLGPGGRFYMKNFYKLKNVHVSSEWVNRVISPIFSCLLLLYYALEQRFKNLRELRFTLRKIDFTFIRVIFLAETDFLWTLETKFIFFFFWLFSNREEIAGNSIQHWPGLKGN